MKVTKEITDSYILESNVQDVCREIIRAMNSDNDESELIERLDAVREDLERRIAEINNYKYR